MSGRLGHQDVAAPQIGGLLLVLRPLQFRERAGLGEVRGHIPCAEVLGQTEDARIGTAHTHQRRAIRLHGRGHLRCVEADLLCFLVECVPLILIVADLIVGAGTLHALRDLLGHSGVLGPVDAPALAVQVPLLCANLASSLVTSLATMSLTILVDPRAPNLNCHNDILLQKSAMVIRHRHELQ